MAGMIMKQAGGSKLGLQFSSASHVCRPLWRLGVVPGLGGTADWLFRCLVVRLSPLRHLLSQCHQQNYLSRLLPSEDAFAGLMTMGETGGGGRGRDTDTSSNRARLALFLLVSLQSWAALLRQVSFCRLLTLPLNPFFSRAPNASKP